VSELRTFNIGMFPWIMIVAATLFFPADWPRHWLSRFRTFVSTRIKYVQFPRCLNSAIAVENPPRVPTCQMTRHLLALLGIYAVVQLALPLRHSFTSQPSAWTCAGFNCAWQVMIVEKTGYAEFCAFEPATGKRWKLSVKNYLSPRQQMMMAQDPYLIRKMARRLATDLKEQGLPEAQIKVNAFATLNGRPSQRLINPEVDLAGTLPPGWILPLND
jgi:vitamin K-dependent gamma-carboxylase